MKTLLLVASLFSAATLSAQIVNGGFDGDASGWMATDVTMSFGGYQSTPGADGNPGWFWINHNGNSAFNPRVEQVLMGLTPGFVYELSGFYRTVVNFFGSDPFIAAINGDAVFFGSTTTVPSNWTEFSFQFTATGNSALLSFLAEVTADADYGVDQITLKPIADQSGNPIPEPSAVAAFAAAALGLLIWARRRR